MGYVRKGSKGVKFKNLKQQFNYYKRQLQRRLISEQAYKYVRTGSLPGLQELTMFNLQNINFETIFNQGITRKVNNKTIRYEGMEAIWVEIESLKKRASKTYQRNQFINNYMEGLFYSGIEQEDMNEIENLFNKISTDHLTYLIDSGILPIVEYLYSKKDKKEKAERIKNALRNESVKKEARRVAKESRSPRIKQAVEDLAEITGI